MYKKKLSELFKTIGNLLEREAIFIKNIILVLIMLLCVSCSSVNMQDRKISKYFRLKEAIYSNTAKKYGIKNIPSNSEYKNIIYTATRMDEVRKALKTQVYVTSWYRNKNVNKKVKGSSNSYHRAGLAVDFKIKGKAKYIRKKLDKAKISYDQLIYYPRQNRMHISFKKSKMQERKQYLVKR
ncbi:D-Ala-D-Ala carboxypeptidase family metallohydrolase [Cetobacterium somerae]|uniref:D-Ala-D-Ala carboxypeptidase family metallohydrolase n=1 Tax=Cetobacterium somerae TaxID=188913 RepID=UPI003892781C